MLYRCRQHFATAGITSAADIVVRRRPTRQLRIEVGRIEIELV
jgi:hypothetical protein